MTNDAEGFGARLGLAMKLLNLSNGAVAREARADKSLVSRWTRGLVTPRGPYLAVLTDIVRARAPGFTQLSWDLPLDEFARLLGGGESSPDVERDADPPVPSPRMSRRTVLAAAAGGVAVAATGGLLLMGRVASSDSVPPEVATLMAQARTAMRQGDTPGYSQAVGLYRKVTEVRPDYADGWGELAGAYCNLRHNGSPASAGEMAARTRDAAARALAIDRENAAAKVALASLSPLIGHWREIELALRAALDRRPDNEQFLFRLGGLMMQVGRMRDAAAILDRAVAHADPSPRLLFLRARTLWAAGRLDDADRAMAEAFALYPTHYAVWFTRFDMLAYRGRPAEALAFAENRDGRPTGISEQSFERIAAAARALATRRDADIDAAMRGYLEAAHAAAGDASNAIEFASAIGRLDDAFAIAEANFFGRGFEVGDVRFSVMQGSYTVRANRRTYMLFDPPTATMRADPRFERLVEEIGLTRYWRESATRPDYRVRG